MASLRLEKKVNGRLILTRDWQRPDRLMPEEEEERKRETGIYFETFVYCRIFSPRHICYYRSEPESCYYEDYKDEKQARKGHKRIVADVKRNPSDYDLREGFVAGMYFKETLEQLDKDILEIRKCFDDPSYRLSSLRNNVDEIEARLEFLIQRESEELKKLSEQFKIFPHTPTELDEQIDNLYSMFETFKQHCCGN